MPLLFSYGTLQDPAVQVATFGRRLDGRPDALTGFERGRVPWNQVSIRLQGSIPEPTDAAAGRRL